VTYDIVGRETSWFERNLRVLLERQKILFYFEGQRFSLGGGLTYRPDFILPGYRVGGRRVVKPGLFDGVRALWAGSPSPRRRTSKI